MTTETVWTGAQGVAGSADTYQKLAYVREGDVTLLQIRGMLTVQPIKASGTSTALSIISFGITDKNEAFIEPPSVSLGITEGRDQYEILWSCGFHTREHSEPAGLFYQPIEINIKSKRRLMDGDRIVMHAISNVDTCLDFVFVGKITAITIPGHLQGT